SLRVEKRQHHPPQGPPPSPATPVLPPPGRAIGYFRAVRIPVGGRRPGCVVSGRFLFLPPQGEVRRSRDGGCLGTAGRCVPRPASSTCRTRERRRRSSAG